eukprot:GHUV01047661.1.p1 GENE.GHUV01047661.1~~GHUV01047661.1.p1  ORF type:complete len:230 (-),score=66.85 GHUV01047661.1:41-730(-)
MCEMLTGRGPTSSEDIAAVFDGNPLDTEALSALRTLLDPKADWPEHQALRFAKLAVACLLPYKKRPNLQTQLVPGLQQLSAEASAAAVAAQKQPDGAPVVPAAVTANSLMESMQCDICSDLLKDPVVTPGGMTFCKCCIESWLENHSTCPISRKTLTTDQLVPNYKLRDLIDRFSKVSAAELLAVDCCQVCQRRQGKLLVSLHMSSWRKGLQEALATGSGTAGRWQHHA